MVGLFALCLVAATSCQRHQIRISKETAIVTATRAADFRVQRTQVRLVRQGLNIVIAARAAKLFVRSQSGTCPRLQ